MQVFRKRAAGQRSGRASCVELWGGASLFFKAPCSFHPIFPHKSPRALAEDIGSGDVTAALVPAGGLSYATLITQEDMILCGSAWLDETFRQLDASVRVEWRCRDGEQVAANAVLCEIRGPARAILTGERCALNFVQTLSGTATTTRQYVAAVAGTGCSILDTRKTLPGLRLAQKYAVRCGGARNLRLGLYDMVLIKENHVIAAGGIAEAIAAARHSSPGVPVEVEVETLAEFRTALAARPDVIMLDEFTQADLRAAVAERNDSGATPRIEVSGRVTLATVHELARAGIDYVSIVSLTKHLHAIELSLRFKQR